MLAIDIVRFIIVLGVLVLIHEFGHFIAAKRAGIWVEEFGFGIPPRIYGKKIGETIYSINLLPLGGFVRLHGENTDEEVTKPERAFLKKNKKTRLLIITAGVLMNFALAIFIFGGVYSVTGIPRNTENVRIIGVEKDSPAAIAGLENGDVVKSVQSQNITSTDGFIKAIDKRKGESTDLVVQRDSQTLDFSITPRVNPPKDSGALGVVITSVENYYPPIWQRPFVGIYYGFKEALFWGGIIIGGLAGIFKQLFSGTVPKDVAGPVGIYALTNQAASYGYISLLNFVGILSVNLAILNIFPFPALDGGRVLFILIESVLGRRVVPKVEAMIHTAGMVILILLILAITIHDVRGLISAGGITGFVNNILQQ